MGSWLSPQRAVVEEGRRGRRATDVSTWCGREQRLSRQFSETFKLTRTQRLYGFGITLGLGLLFLVVVRRVPSKHVLARVGALAYDARRALPFPPQGIVALYVLKLTAFGAFYSLGNICLVGRSVRCAPST